MNNPLLYTDPTGNKWYEPWTWSLKRGWDNVWEGLNNFAEWADRTDWFPSSGYISSSNFNTPKTNYNINYPTYLDIPEWGSLGSTYNMEIGWDALDFDYRLHPSGGGGYGSYGGGGLSGMGGSGGYSYGASTPLTNLSDGRSELGGNSASSGRDSQLSPSIPASIAIGGGFIGGLENSYKYGSQTVKYAQRINGQVRSAQVLTRASQMNAAKMASGLKVVGRGFTGLSIATAGYQFAISDMSGNDYARLSGSLIITGAAFIPIVGPVITIGLGVADSYGAFDDIYNYFE